MDRRDFFRLAGAAGLCVTPGLHAFADEQNPEPMDLPEVNPNGLFFVQIQASGGWEPTMLCDPKGNLNKTYGEGDILTAGNINYAPMGEQWNTFFQTNFQRMVVFNGVDVQTNAHAPGQEYTASGRLGASYPTIAALVAGFQGPHLPVALLSFGAGGYVEPRGVVATTRSIDADRLGGIIFPDRVNPASDASELYHSERARDLISIARRTRAEQARSEMRLPKVGQSMDTLITTRLGSDELKRLEEVLPTLGASSVDLAVAAYRAGIGTAVNYVVGGFDTHQNHDAAHSSRMNGLLGLANNVWAKVDAAGIAHRTVMLINSEFGRTPGYNGNNGKDHWPVSSMILISGMPEFKGNRVIGQSTAGHVPIMLDPDTLEAAGDGVNGFRLRPGHVHRGIRDLVGMTGDPLDERFPISASVDLRLV